MRQHAEQRAAIAQHNTELTYVPTLRSGVHMLSGLQHRTVRTLNHASMYEMC
jgi:hypothetical protein